MLIRRFSAIVASALLVCSESAVAQNREPDLFIEKARSVALSFLEGLPNYVVQRTMIREEKVDHAEFWTERNRVSAEVVYDVGVESYRNVQLDGKPAEGSVKNSGGWSTGEFGMLLKALFTPSTHTLFRPRTQAKSGGREARVYSFSVSQSSSGWKLVYGGKVYVTAYEGSIWLDQENARTLKFEMRARGIPSSFPIDSAESSTEYGTVRIGGRDFLLPLKSITLGCNRSVDVESLVVRGPMSPSQPTVRSCVRNLIEFRDYKQFTVDSKIKFDPVAR